MKKFTRAMLLTIADGMRIAATNMGKEAKAARELGFTDLASACISRATEFEKLADLFGRSLTSTPKSARQHHKEKQA